MGIHARRIARASGHTTTIPPEAPNPPVARITNITSTSAAFAWDPPTQPNGVIAGYTIGYTYTGSSTVLFQTSLAATVYTYTFTGLSASTSYDFWVQATNDVGLTSARTLVTQPTSTGQTITASAVTASVSNSSVSLQGSITTTGTVTFDGLNISIARDQSPTYPWVASVAISNGQTVSNNTYNLFGTTSLAEGAYVAYVSYSLDSQATWTTGPKTSFSVLAPVSMAPNAPVAQITNTGSETVAMSWNAPTEPNGTITSYSVGYRRAGEQTVLFQTSLAASTLAYTFTGLTKNTAYEFWVDATNSSSLTSPKSIIFTTTANVPGGTLPDYDVTFYTGVNYTGTALGFSIGNSAIGLGGSDNTFQSVKLRAPSKLYAAVQPYLDRYVMSTQTSIPDLSQCTLNYGWTSFANEISSFQVYSAAEEMPRVATYAVTLSDGSRILQAPRSDMFSNVAIDNFNFVNSDQTAYNTFISQTVPLSQQANMFRQAARNACAVMYETPFDIAMAHKNLTVTAVANVTGTTGASGGAMPWYGTMEMARGVSTHNGNTARVVLHETSHMFSRLNTRIHELPANIKQLEEGLADYSCLAAGSLGVARPAGGGSSWSDGYVVTAYFFDYIERNYPGFVKRFVRSFSLTDLSVKVSPWTTAVIPPLAGGRTIDQLWASYKSWVASGANLVPLGAKVAATTSTIDDQALNGQPYDPEMHRICSHG